MPYQNIEANIDASLQSELLERLRSISEQLPFLINLTPKERRSGGMLTHNNYSFTQAALDYATNNTALLPPSFSLAAWQSDVDLYNKLSPIIQQMGQLLEALQDTHLALRMESQRAALDFLALAKLASKSNIAGTTELVADLSGKLNSRRGVRNKKPEM